MIIPIGRCFKIWKNLKFNLYVEERDSYEEKISIRCYGFISHSYQ